MYSGAAMTIQQTIMIPENRRIILDLPAAPSGRARIEVTITPEEEKPASDSCNGQGASRVTPLWGRAKALGAKLTLERFMEMQREDIEREIEQENRLWNREK